MTERRRAPLEVLERLAEAAAEYWQGMKHAVNEPRRNHLLDCLETYRAATSPLRTRAEVDAEIATCTRLHVRYWGTDGPDNVHAAETRWKGIQRLCSEPTTDEPEPNATTDHDADLRDPEPCGCEEAGELRARLTRIKSMAGTYRSGEPYSALAAIRKECEGA
jgi:hypothetical protein